MRERQERSATGGHALPVAAPDLRWVPITCDRAHIVRSGDIAAERSGGDPSARRAPFGTDPDRAETAP